MTAIAATRNTPSTVPAAAGATTAAGVTGTAASTGAPDDLSASAPMSVAAAMLAAANRIQGKMDLVIANARSTIAQMQSNNNALQSLQDISLPQVSWPQYSRPPADQKEQDARDAAAFEATRALEAQGTSLAAYTNRYRVATTDNYGNVTYTYSDHAHQPRIPSNDPHQKEEMFVVNPTPDQLLEFMSMVAKPPLESLSQTMLLAGVNVENAGAYDAAKYAWGPQNEVGYSRLPATVVDNPATAARDASLNGALVQEKQTGLYYRIQDGAAYPVRSCLPLDTAILVDPGTTDFSAWQPGTLIKMQTGADKEGNPLYTYYQIAADGGTGKDITKLAKAVEVTPLLEFKLNPDEKQLNDWNDQLSKLNMALGAISNTEQAYLQEKMVAFTNFLSLASNILSEYFRGLNNVRF